MNELNNHRSTILIVDDVPNNIEILLGALERDYDTQFATSGAEALELIKSELPDLILLDVMMPGMDGYEVCRRLKDTPATQNIPIIFVTARDAIRDQEHGFNLGAVDYITKPYEISLLRARVRTHITLKRKSDLLETLVALDGLTGIPNRRRFDETLCIEWRRAIREQVPLALIMADVDQFKNYNDFYGHGAGDDCLRDVATCLVEAVRRPGDLAARYGGEEFAVILPDCDSTGAQYVAEQFRALVINRGIPHLRSSVANHVTISAGVAACIPAVADAPEELLKTADLALYQAKWNGRNRVYQSVINHIHLN
ncbi:diguanylate cyclase domain-containing protein [Chromatium okenii]|jgi:diguanylate cyclase (GGDEF)-like protein|uniref:diguanylate cyclase n=1 Tax=Chromatium okenii TaxID=61644 RepID=A0A2S7XN66_9GAMM|nr:diguanylate cyclase [Chromatium okenii]PQJ95179.1 diguanylate cyclase response regulator [Chromatium okenii]